MKTFSAKCYRHVFLVLALLVSGCDSPEQKSQGYYDRGISLIEKKDDLNARVELLNAIKYKGDKVETWRALAGIDERTKAYQALFQDLRRIVELDPNDIVARLKLGKMLLAGGAPDAALKIVEGAENISNDNASVHALKAAILVKMRDTNGGLLEARKAAELDASDVEAAILLASERLSKGDVDGALRVLSVPPIVSKNDFRVDQIRAQIFAQKGDLSQAENILHTLIGQKPQDIGLRDQLARIYIGQRRFDEAEKELRAIAAANPENSGAEFAVVRLLAAVKGPAKARDELVSRIRAGGDVFPYKMALADLDFNQGRFDDSVALLQGLIDAPGSPANSLVAQAKLSELYFQKANYPAAEKLAADILKKDPRNIAGLKIRASIRIEQGQFESAIADLREALNGQPKSPELLLLLATAYERDGKPELADRQYADATRSAADNPAVSLRYVAFLQRQGRAAQAEDFLTRAVSASPQSIDLLNALAQIRLARQNWSGAMAVADSIQAIGNDGGIADFVRGAAFAGQNKMEQSTASLEAAHAAAPDALQTIESLVNSYIRTGKSEKAEALLRDMQKKYPENIQLSLLMGGTQLAKNNIDEATNSFKSSIALHPKDEAGYLALSDLFTRQKDYDQASKTLQDGLQELPENLNLHLAIAKVMIATKNYEGAIAKYESILKTNPNTPIAINNLASLLLDYRTDQASSDRAYSLSEGLKSSNVPELQDTFGWAQYTRGDYKTAVSVLEKAASNLPTLAVLQYHLGMSYKATGDIEKAEERFKIALRLEPDETPLNQKIRSAIAAPQ